MAHRTKPPKKTSSKKIASVDTDVKETKKPKKTKKT